MEHKKYSFHEGAVRALCFSPKNQEIIATGSADGFVKLVHLPSHTELHAFHHQGEVNCVAISSSAQYLLSAGDTGLAKIWNLITKEEVQVFDVHDQTTPTPVYSCAISRSEEKCIFSTWDGTIHIFGFPYALAKLCIFQAHESIVTSLAINDEFTRCMTGSWDHTCCVWDLTSLSCLHVLTGHTSDCNAVAMSPSGELGVTGSNDCTAILWDLVRGEPLYVLDQHTNTIGGVALRVWEQNQWACLTASWDGVVQYYTSDDPSKPIMVDRHEERVACVVFSARGNWFVSGSFDHTLSLGDLRLDDRKRILLLATHTRLPMDIVKMTRDMLY